jgi:hypothetical protein
MKKILLLFGLILCLCSYVYADDICGDYNTSIVLTHDYNATEANCIRVTSSFVTIDCDGHYIRQGIDTLIISSYPYTSILDCNLRGGNIILDGANHSDVSNLNIKGAFTSLYINKSNDIIFTNIIANGSGDYNVFVLGGSTDIHFIDSILIGAGEDISLLDGDSPEAPPNSVYLTNVTLGNSNPIYVFGDLYIEKWYKAEIKDNKNNKVKTAKLEITNSVFPSYDTTIYSDDDGKTSKIKLLKKKTFAPYSTDPEDIDATAYHIKVSKVSKKNNEKNLLMTDNVYDNIVLNSTGGYEPQYGVSDLSLVFIDGVGSAGSSFVSWISLLILALILYLFAKYFSKKK